MNQTLASARRARLWIGGSVPVILLALGAYVYPGARLAWEILRTPSQPLVLSKWETMRLKAARRNLVDNERHVHAGAFTSRGGSTLAYLDIEPANYAFEVDVRPDRTGFVVNYRYGSNGMAEPGPTRGVVFVLHGYGLFKEIMLPWGMLLAQHGYRTVLIDLPAHGASSPGMVGFGRKDAELLKEFCDDYRSRTGFIGNFTAVLGCSYGATAALHLGALDPGVDAVIAMAPFVNLETAVRGFAGALDIKLPESVMGVATFIIKSWIGKGGLELPIGKAGPPEVLFVRPQHDQVTPDEEFAGLVEYAYPNAEVDVLHDVGHMEAGLPFPNSVARVLEFLDRAIDKRHPSGVVECALGE